MQAYLDRIQKNYIETMEFSAVPALSEIADDMGVSKQTIRRRFAELEYGSYRGFVSHLRKALIAKIKDAENSSLLDVGVALGFRSSESIFRYIRDNYKTTPNRFLGANGDCLKHVYVFEFPNGSIKFGVSANPFIRVGSHIVDHLSGNQNPVNAFCTVLTDSFLHLEKELISRYSEFSISSSGEWVAGVSFNEIKEYLEVVANADAKENYKDIPDSRGAAKLSDKPTVAQQCKQAGLSSLAELQKLTGIPRRTLYDWHRAGDQTKFKLALDAALYRKGNQNGTT